ncbi:beta-mannanase [Paenibacillus brevis]|uniref:Beta-mannanase n=1 Tax=Paenibacillus brevis TaxID=2841508 RepID=A0ABS6FKS6_9BACL|nr:beta-mannanase [Paenibacillus brevis]MBU5670638.1 beta-mannanase [Paenibacillus brevis]
MRVIDATSSTPAIRDMTHSLDEDRVCLRWRWPEGVQAVYIHKGPVSDSAADRIPDEEDLKLYTREEYKASGGYRDRLEEIGQVQYTVYAGLMEEDELELVLQQDGRNRLTVNAGRARIFYTISQKNNLFRKYKSIQIQVMAEAAVAKDVLCYVKKQGGYPANKEDGTVYHFLHDFVPGKNILPVIEVGKNDYVRLFFTDGRKYGQFYELIAQ